MNNDRPGPNMERLAWHVVAWTFATILMCSVGLFGVSVFGTGDYQTNALEVLDLILEWVWRVALLAIGYGLGAGGKSRTAPAASLSPDAVALLSALSARGEANDE